MCTFQNERTVVVCNVAIHLVREHLQETFGEIIQYTMIDGQSTLVQAPSTVNAARFQEATREAIVIAQATTVS